MKKKILSTLLTVAVALTTLTGCGGDKSSETSSQGDIKQVDLKIWTAENQVSSGTMDSMTKSFQDLHPEWKINYTVEIVGEDVAKDEILKDVEMAGDVFFFASDQLPDLVNAGAIAKLGGSVEEMVKADMSPQVVDTATYEDHLYAIPFTHNTFFMYYDKSLLSEENIKSVEDILAVSTPENVYNFCFDNAGGWKLGAWYYGAGLSIYGENGTEFEKGCDWNTPTGIAVTNYIIDLLNNPKVAYADDISVTELIETHRLGAWFDGAWNYNVYKEALGDDLGVAILPTFNPDGNDYQLKSFYSSKLIGVNSKTKNPEVAVEFAKYLGSEEMQIQRFKETAQAPTNLKASEIEEVKNDIVSNVLIQESEAASVIQPTSIEFSKRYWVNAGAIATEIRGKTLTKDNVQEKMDTFVKAMEVK
ncbi:extracellular solute-binding protein [[Clostridium] colinum]|uniref:extracellular solute-binding protein n=1 Tax=[Clostridium] colinum TaxID=36835 RepID=UPI00202442EF|nr:extracellular solute-binding protein [[Clostridium] colinum]